jgi:gamma-glutamylcyclotransferase (GGCT)/AIG2-like uncharacterized protein YtfP
MNRAAAPIVRVFVYGTLKTGELRERMWPCKPIAVNRATTRGELYDLNRYPAMVAGDDLVLGEVWSFTIDQMPKTLKVLDEIEDFDNLPNDQYKRVSVECEFADGRSVIAYAYHYAADDLAEATRIQATNDGLCQWPNRCNGLV